MCLCYTSRVLLLTFFGRSRQTPLSLISCSLPPRNHPSPKKMATDYSKKTNADLVEILKSRSLPHTGKKADLVARLQEDDSKNAGTTAAPVPAAKADVADDVIDWEDDEPTEGAAAAPKASTEAGATTIEAGGKGQAPNPAAVPNQKLDENPAATSDLKVEATGAETGPAGSQAAPAEGAGGGGGGDRDEQTAEKSDAAYAKGLPITEMEEELKKRKARAEKFGITEESQAAIADAEKQLDRAKRFGSGVEAPDVGVKRLDEALPQEKSRKRGQHDNDASGRGGKRRHFGGRNRSRQQGGNRNRRDGGNNSSSGRSNGQQTVVTEQDRAAMEARAKRFAAA